MKKFFTKTKNRIDVYYDPKNSHASTHFRECEGLENFVKQTIENFEATKQEERFETDMGVQTGFSDLIKVEEGDETFYAIRELRDKYSHFVKNKQPEPTTFITTCLFMEKDGSYNLYTAWVGKMVPSFPSGPEDTNIQGKEFWEKHALAVGKQKIREETITTNCPW